ncbi:3-isopropylmalate dehydratase small subunit [Aestuariibacter sp. GS-14]|uniref:3-isopropylmalate dehydratase small subunit n=1 Tax=Aestuariibacter sp. GS-14 TaxID=2590670 RepID=UPI0011282F28|nr:3-isopropylmalate dehydratase small subunit [Aestuariibacter sp. GS-14]TPV61789.1 3-isopropylmalate dehydratase small subunit [Aestuariibacter sp. GS-14]
MKAITVVSAKAIPLLEDNIDTDQLLPKQFLTEISRQGFGKHLLHDWRYLDSEESVPNPDCVLNQAQYRGAEILVTGDNFGCGSSREHAPWAIADFGIRIIVAKSFADIFRANCLNNQILPVTLPAAAIDEIGDLVSRMPDTLLKLDLPEQVLHVGSKSYTFDIESHHKNNLIGGVDKIGRTLLEINLIQEFESRSQNIF